MKGAVMKKLFCALSLLVLSVQAVKSTSPDGPSTSQAGNGVSALTFCITYLSKNKTGTGNHTLPTSAPVEQKWLDFVYGFIAENATHKKRNYFKIEVEESIYFSPDKLTQTVHTHTFNTTSSTQTFITEKLKAYGCEPTSGGGKPLVTPLVIQFTLTYGKK